jgi:hypothetical protein
MRDLVVREALVEMARDAAKRFRELVAAGEEIPYDVRESGDGSPIPQYVPLTERFVRDHARALHELDSFGAACAALESAGLAGPYLRDSGIEAPPDARRRAELAGVVFLARLWMDSTDFSLDDERLRMAIEEVEANGDAGLGEVEVVVPLRGLRMEATRLTLATGWIVRADTVDVPAEARAPEASGGAGWEPTFLAVATVDATEPEDGEPSGTRSVQAFHEIVTALRLFKPGGVSLGPYAWTRVGSGRWRRISTGAGKPRPGGYRLAETELSELAAFSKGVHARMHGATGPRYARGLERAIARFEAGLERTAAIDALNDHLLALRFVLEGGGPADLGLAMRVASLCAEPDSRSEVKAVIDRALALERQLWSGEPVPGGSSASPAETALEVEELARAILKDAACGHLGNDLRATADEILLADGLAVGDGVADQGGTSEWDPEPAEEPDGDEPAREAPEPGHGEMPTAVEEALGEPAGEDRGATEPAVDEPVARAPESFEWQSLPLDATRMPDREPAEAVSEPAAAEPTDREIPDEPRYGREAPVVRGLEWEGEDEPEVKVIRGPQRITLHRIGDQEETEMIEDHREPVRPTPLADGEGPVARLLAIHSAEREATASRVANLFPAPETTEWTVREISYDRSRRSQAAPQAS